ncbi:cytochrome d ubiquinol oxidase subunit II [candidate division CSSED10-310 bacterium]|uniref:Cytochrome d ubiquinol oxidase subunit II n=1 Tax=candidate division CSSED10-310 bacterium TaxID=2855610 RepID=A0ABV6YW01_UNCC1
MLEDNIYSGGILLFLETTCFFLWVLCWAMYITMDGFDLGCGMLLPFLGKKDQEKLILKTTGPLWAGNEIWLLVMGVIPYFVFPLVYRVLVSAFEVIILLILIFLFIRGLIFIIPWGSTHQPGSKIRIIIYFVCSVGPCFLFGLVFANIFRGLAIGQSGIYHGSYQKLVNIYGLWGGLLFLILCLEHGALWWAMKTEGWLKTRAVEIANMLWPPVLVVIIVFLIGSRFSTFLYDNYLVHPCLFILLALTILSVSGIKLFLSSSSYKRAWLSSCCTLVGIIFFCFGGHYPNLLHSSIHYGYNLTVHNAASEPRFLQILLMIAILFLPLMTGYQLWALKVFIGPKSH